MDKITHQVRAEQMESQKNSSSTGRGSCEEKLLRIPGSHHSRQPSERIRGWCQHLRGPESFLAGV